MPALRRAPVMTHAELFPAALIVLNLAAVVAYGLEGDWRRAIYWGAAAVLTAVVRSEKAPNESQERQGERHPE